MYKFNEVIFKSIFSNKMLLAGLINLIDNETIDIKYLDVLFLEPIGFEKDMLKINNVIALYENPNGKRILYSLEYRKDKSGIKAIDYINNDYIFLSKYRSILAAKHRFAMDLEIRIINFINYVEYKDKLCIRNLFQYKGNFYVIELPKINYLDDSILKELLSCMILNNIDEKFSRSDIVGVLARLIEKENKNPRVIRELKQLEESKLMLVIKYQSGYHQGMKVGYDDGYIVGKNETINNVVLALNRERISKHRIAKIVNLSEIEVKGIIDNNKKDTFSLNK